MSADRITLEVYGAEAVRYAGMKASETEGRSMARFLALLRPGARILDLGCGPGDHAASMQASGFRVAAWDACPEFVATARSRGLHASEKTFDDLDVRGAFDAVWASFSLLHAPRAELPRHLLAIARALVPGGRLFLAMKLGNGERRDSLGRFYAYYSEAELRTCLAEAGFTINEAETGKGTGLAGTEDPFILMICRNA